MSAELTKGKEKVTATEGAPDADEKKRNAAFAEMRKQLAEMEKRNAELEAALNKHASAAEEASMAKAEKEKDWQKLIEQHEKRAAQFKAELEKERSLRENHLKKSAFLQALSDKVPRPERLYGQFKELVKIDKDGNPVNTEELIGSVKDTFPELFAEPPKETASANGDGDGGKTISTIDRLNAALRGEN